MNENNDKLFKSINEFGVLLNAVKTSSPVEERAKKSMLDCFYRLSFSTIVDECENLKLDGELSADFEKIEKGARLLSKSLAKTYGKQMATRGKWGQDKLKLEIKQACLAEAQKNNNNSNENA